MALRQITISIFIIFFCCYSALSLAAKSAGKGKIPPVFVETTIIKPTLHLKQISSTGTLLSIPGIVVKPEISGRITKIYFKSGENAEKGDILVEINPDIAKAKLESALAALKLSKLNFERSRSLYKTKDISKSAFDEAQANYNSAQANIEGAKALLQQTIIRAPFSGKLGLSQADEGDFISAGQNIVNLQTMDPLKVDFSIPEAYQSKVAISQKLSLKSDAYPKETFAGTVEAIESMINPSNRTLNIRANVPNKDRKLIPGGFAEITLQFAKQERISIPQTAIVYSANGNYVFKAVDGKAVKTIIVIGEKDSKNAVVKSGLKTGDVIVTSGQIKIQPGSPLVVVNGKNINNKRKIKPVK